jgi:hypothetical protein
MLSRSPYLQALTALDLGEPTWFLRPRDNLRNLVGPEGTKALTEAWSMTRLTRLDLACNEIGDRGVQSLAEMPRFAHLTALNLAGNQVGFTGVSALVTSKYLTGLRSLNLRSNELDDRAVALLARSLILNGVVELDLSQNRLTSASAASLAASPYLKCLKRLRIEVEDNRQGGSVGETGLRALAESPHLRSLRDLWILAPAAVGGFPRPNRSDPDALSRRFGPLRIHVRDTEDIPF